MVDKDIRVNQSKTSLHNSLHRSIDILCESTDSSAVNLLTTTVGNLNRLCLPLDMIALGTPVERILVTDGKGVSWVLTGQL